MRKAARIVFSLLLAYLVQATMLPYFRIGSIILDVTTIVLYTAGFACGTYAGIVTGLLGALFMEVLSGDLPGLSSAVAIAAGIFGAYVARWTSRYQRANNKRLERFVKDITPVLGLGLLIAIREAIFIAYFYLTGTEITIMHMVRAIRCAIVTMVGALLLIPILSRFMTRDPQDTLIAKWKKRRQNRKLPKKFGPTIELPKELPLDKPELLIQFPVEPDFFSEIIELLPVNKDDQDESTIDAEAIAATEAEKETE